MNTMLSQVLVIIGSSIFLILGSLHLLYTFFTNKFLAKNSDTTEAMKNTYPLITKKTTMWNAWIGFNASHSLGGMYFGVINIILAVAYYDLLVHSPLIQLLNLLFCFSYLLLAVKYWFRTPLVGILAATCCFLISAILQNI